MLRAILFGGLLLCTSRLYAFELVPGSTSPDGRYALAFEHPAPASQLSPSRLWFVRLPGRARVSAQLRPTLESIYRTEYDKDGGKFLTYRDEHAGPVLDSRQLMYSIVVDVAESLLRGQARGEGYGLRWSPDGKQVTVWVGAHKFSWACVYGLRGGRFYRRQEIPGYVPPEWRVPGA